MLSDRESPLKEEGEMTLSRTPGLWGYSLGGKRELGASQIHFE